MWTRRIDGSDAGPISFFRIKLLRMPESDIMMLIEGYEKECHILKKSFYRLIWSMRGGITSNDLFHVLSQEDREIMEEIVNENIEISKKNGMAIL